MKLLIFLSLSLFFISLKAQDQLKDQIQSLKAQMEEKKEHYEILQKTKDVYEEVYREDFKKRSLNSEIKFYDMTRLSLLSSASLVFGWFSVQSFIKVYKYNLNESSKEDLRKILSTGRGKFVETPRAEKRKALLKFFVKNNKAFIAFSSYLLFFVIFFDQLEDEFFDQNEQELKELFVEYQKNNGILADTKKSHEVYFKQIQAFENLLKDLENSLEKDQRKLEKLQNSLALSSKL